MQCSVVMIKRKLPYLDAGEQEQDEVRGERREPGRLEVQELDLGGPAAAAADVVPAGVVLEEDVGGPQVAVADDGEVVLRPHHLHLDLVEAARELHEPNVDKALLE
ncbi:unnamed protein product [Sphagnum tenellum]